MWFNIFFSHLTSQWRAGQARSQSLLLAGQFIIINLQVKKEGGNIVKVHNNNNHLKKQQYVLFFCVKTSQFSEGFVISDTERGMLEIHVLPYMSWERLLCINISFVVNKKCIVALSVRLFFITLSIITASLLVFYHLLRFESTNTETPFIYYYMIEKVPSVV